MTQPIFAPRATVLAVTLAAALLLPSSAFAHGALAVGADYRSDGSWSVNVGYGVDYDTERGARSRAMDECSAPGRGSAGSRAACKIETTFSHKCFALAIDTKTGSYGWALRDGMSQAKDGSVNNCVKYGGSRHLCKISYFGCDK